MLKSDSRIGFVLVGGLLFATGLTVSAGLNSGGVPRIKSSSAVLGFALPSPQKQIARVSEMVSAPPQMEIPPKLRAKQEKDMRKIRFEKLKDHAAELAKLSADLKDDLDKSNENILSLKVVDKAEKIEKLAKKIQDEAKAEPGLPRPMDTGDF